MELISWSHISVHIDVGLNDRVTSYYSSCFAMVFICLYIHFWNMHLNA
jgi:hypothetical protein